MRCFGTKHAICCIVNEGGISGEVIETYRVEDGEKMVHALDTQHQQVGDTTISNCDKSTHNNICAW